MLRNRLFTLLTPAELTVPSVTSGEFKDGPSTCGSVVGALITGAE